MDDLDDILGGLTKGMASPQPERKQQASLPFKDASNTFKSQTGSVIETKVTEDNLKDVIIKKFPMSIPDFQSYRSIPCYNFQATNNRNVEVKLIVKFVGNNLKLMAGPKFILTDSRTVEGYLKPGENIHFCMTEPEDKTAKVFDDFDTDVLCHPAQGVTNEESLEEVTLYNRANFGDETSFEFEAFNGKTFEVIVEVTIQGDILKKSGALPFKVNVKPNERVKVGSVSSKHDISSSWKWSTAPSAAKKPNLQKQTHRHEAQGVFLTQIQTPAEMNLLEFEVENTHPFDILVEIDFVGDGQLDTKGESRPLKKTIKAKSSEPAGSVSFKGQIGTSWNWRELK